MLRRRGRFSRGYSRTRAPPQVDYPAMVVPVEVPRVVDAATQDIPATADGEEERGGGLPLVGLQCACYRVGAGNPPPHTGSFPEALA